MTELPVIKSSDKEVSVSEILRAEASAVPSSKTANAKWYIVNVVSGQENKIASEIKSMMISGSFHDQIFEVLVPTKSLIKVKRGQKVQEQQKLFPGYIFVNCNLSLALRSAIKSIPKVMTFLGGNNNPEAVSDEKMAGVIGLISSEISDQKNLRFELGETLSINEGPFESFTGTVESFDSERQKVKLSVLIFGRATSVELDINQVERAND